MALHIDVTNNEVTVTPPDEIDIATGDLLARRIERACALGPSTIAVDFRNVTFCDSTAVAVLLSALEKLEVQDCRLIIRNPCTLLRKIVTVLGEAGRLGIPPTQVPPTPSGRWAVATTRKCRSVPSSRRRLMIAGGGSQRWLREPHCRMTHLYDEEGEPNFMVCTRCGERTRFDPTLPYVNQTVAFVTGHDCPRDQPDHGE